LPCQLPRAIVPAAARPGPSSASSCRRVPPGRTRQTCCCALITTACHVMPSRPRRLPSASCREFAATPRRGSTSIP